MALPQYVPPKPTRFGRHQTSLHYPDGTIQNEPPPGDVGRTSRPHRSDYGWELKTIALGGAPARMAGHNGNSLGGNVASLMTFPERGIAVAVVSNISYADTAAVAEKIAHAFAA